MIKKAMNEARKAAGLPPESEEEEQARKQQEKRIGAFGDQMARFGCGLTIVSLLVFILLALL